MESKRFEIIETEGSVKGFYVIVAAILMVTHDAYAASYANRILFLQDGKIVTELLNKADDRKIFSMR